MPCDDSYSSSIRMTYPIRRASVIPKWAFGKPPAAASLASADNHLDGISELIELEGDEPRSNEVERSEAHPQPQQQAKKKRAPAHLFQRGPRDAAADEEQW